MCNGAIALPLLVLCGMWACDGVPLYCFAALATLGLALQITYRRRRLLTIWHDLQNLRIADLTFICQLVGVVLASVWAI